MGSIRLRETTREDVDTLCMQWMEYNVIYMRNVAPSNCSLILKEFNEALSSQSYFGGNEISAADKAIFRSLRNIMMHMTFQDKEKYLHLSRWFNYMQNEEGSARKITFSRSLLYQ